MTTVLSVKAIHFHEGKVVNQHIVNKNINESVTIGRDPHNDVVVTFSTLSRTHGRIFVEQGVFTEHLDYEDTSSRGSTILHWNGTLTKHQLIKREKIKIHPNDWILIMDSGLFGVILIPSIV